MDLIYYAARHIDFKAVLVKSHKTKVKKRNAIAVSNLYCYLT